MYLSERIKIIAEPKKDYDCRLKWYGDNGYSTLKYLLTVEIPFFAGAFEVYRNAPKCGIRNTK